VGREVRPVAQNKIKTFFFIFFDNSPKIPILSTKNPFSQVGPKIKVA
jgi:hypothetical protein